MVCPARYALIRNGYANVRRVRWFHNSAVTIQQVTNEQERPRINPVGIQYLSNSLHEQVFPNKNKFNRLFDESEKKELIKLSQQMLKNHDLLGKPTNITDPISFRLPELQGNSLDEHFQKIGHFASEPYKSMCEKKFTKIVPRPEVWLREPGWYMYEPNKPPERVPYPLEDTLVFDVEVLYKLSDFPTLAVALSDKAWYSWCSPFICDYHDRNSIKHLIPMNTLHAPKLIIGHNVGYDRSKVLEEYNFTPSKAFFLDTMSLHVASSGMCSRQRPTYLKSMKRSEEIAQLNLENEHLPPIADVSQDSPWLEKSATNSLKDVARFYCNIKMSKEARDEFAALDKQKIIDDFQKMMDYCATDVEVTSKVFDKVFPAFINKCPHPVSFGALRFISSSILPTNISKWQHYLESSESLFQDNKKRVEDKITALIEDTVKLKDSPKIIEKDPWLRQLDWTVMPVKYTKSGEPHKNQKLPGFPEWYRSLFPSKDSTKPHITIRSRQVPLFFKLTWEDCPVIWTTSEGWCFRCATSKTDEMKAKNYVLAKDVADYKEQDTVLFKIPHPNGPQFSCSTLMSKPFVHFFEKSILKSQSQLAQEALQINAAGAYWMSARERIMSQHAVSVKDFSSEFNSESGTARGSDTGIILPRVVPMGTVTRRSVENTWLTASNAKKNRIGSELKCNVSAPPGYTFVGADVDSEELWIASLVGDSIFDMHGGTAIGWMCLEGTKSMGTDLHSKTANILGCSRDEAKVFNYGRIYGAGVKFAAQLLKKFNPSLSEEFARKTAEKLYESTKGQKARSKVFKSFWYGGSESILFNKLESIAEQEEPKTPVLGAGITYPLMKKNLGKDSFLPSRINWVIQSSGVDYLHILCCSMNYLIQKYSLDARLMISIHDEIRYIVSEKDKYKLALALQISNLWTRAYFSEQMCINDLPQNCAFFSAVDIDKVLRKEVDMDCITPSNPHAIPHGESLDILQILDATEGVLGRESKAVDVSHFPFKPREAEFVQYNKRYSKAFLKFSLAMQVQTNKRRIYGIEEEYERAVYLSRIQPGEEDDMMTMADYLESLKKDSKNKRTIMNDSTVYSNVKTTATDASERKSNLTTAVVHQKVPKTRRSLKSAIAKKQSLSHSITIDPGDISRIVSEAVCDTKESKRNEVSSSQKIKSPKRYKSQKTRTSKIENNTRKSPVVTVNNLDRRTSQYNIRSSS